jgi:hypothetical protein
LKSAFELSPEEIKRLEALKSLLLATGVSTKSVPRPAKSLDARHRTILGQFILAMVAADGVVQQTELAVARSLFSRRGLDATQVERAFTMSWVRPQTSQTRIGSESISVPGVDLVIDRAAIDRIMADTRAMANLLADSMQTEVAELDVVESVVVTHATTLTSSDRIWTMWPNCWGYRPPSWTMSIRWA